MLRPELMDDPGLDATRHVQALGALRTVNALSGTVGRIWRHLLELGLSERHPLRVLDLACGGGDVAVSLRRRARDRGLPLEVGACDVSHRALGEARKLAARSGVEVDFFPLDALTDPIPAGYDLIVSSLFLHHLGEAEAVDLLAAMARAAPAVHVQDLRRTRVGYLLAMLTLQTLSRSDVARVDGLRSVEGAFTLPEIARLAGQAGLGGASLRSCWPQRFVLSWRRK